MHILAYVGPFEGDSGMECGALISLNEGARYNEVYAVELHDVAAAATTEVDAGQPTKIIAEISVGTLQVEDLETAMNFDLPFEIGATGFAFIGFSDVGSEYESDYEYELNFIMITSHDAAVLTVFGVGENDECTIAGEGIEAGYFEPYIIVGPDYFGDMDNFAWEL